MNKLVKSLMIAAAVTLSAGTTLAAQAQDQSEAKNLDELLQLVEKNRVSSRELNAEREREFTKSCREAIRRRKGSW